MQAMGLKESRGSPYLPQEVIAPLELECPDAAIHSPVRSLLAVPILLHVAPLLDATPVTPQPPRPNAARAPVPASTQVRPSFLQSADPLKASLLFACKPVAWL